MAYAAVHGDVSLDMLDPASLEDANVLAVAQRVEALLDVVEQGDGRGRFPMPGTVTLTTANGKTQSVSFEHVRGHPLNPMDFGEVAAKVRACAQFGLPSWGGVETAIETVSHLDRANSLENFLPPFAD